MGDVENPLTGQPNGEQVSRPVDSVAASGDRAPEATRTRHSALEPTSGLESAAEAEAYDFLAAAQAADELGRLGGYRVLRVLGEGGMGVVFEAEDPLLHRRVALKAMKPRLANADARLRFLREAQTAASAEHENIVTILQVGDDRGIPFIAMPLLRGETLADRMARSSGHPLPLGDILRIGREIATGLAAAHEQGLIHRDVKPANIWLEAKTGRVKLLDFGLARAADEDQHLTQTGAVLGTPSYMSPEQARGEPVDHGTDLFSLGCVLYHIATGRRPFHGASAVGTLLAVATVEPAAPATVNATLPEALDRLICELMAKQRSARPASAEQVVERLLTIERVAAPGTSEDGLPRPSPKTLSGCESRAPETIITESLLPSSPPVSSPHARRRKLFLAVAASAAALFVAAAVTLMRRGDVPRYAEQSAPALPSVGAGPELSVSPPDSHKRDAYTTKEEIDWSPGADEGYLPGIVPRPANLPGIGRWQVATRVPRGGTIAFNALAFSPDSRWLAVITNDGHVRLYDADTRRLRRILIGHAGAALAVAWSPDADVFATGGADHEIRLWSVRQAKTTAVLRGHTAEVTALAWSRDGRLASGAGWGDSSVRIWSVEGQHEANVQYGAAVTSLAWSPDGQRLAVAGVSRGVLLATAGGRHERTLDDGMYVRCLAFSPDGGLLASGGADGGLRVWHTADWSLSPVLHVELASRVAGLAFNNDGNRLAIVNEDLRTYVFDTSSGARRELTKFSGGIGYGMAWSHDDQLLAVADNNGDFDFYDHELAPVERLVLGLSAKDPVLSATGLFAATVSADRKSFLRIVEPDGRRNQSYSVLTPALFNWSPDGKLLAATHYDAAGHHSIFDASTGESVASWPAPAGSLFNCLSPDGKRLATGGTDKTVTIWSLKGERLAQSPILPGGVRALAWHPDGRQLVAALDPSGPKALLHLFDAGLGSPLKLVSSVSLPCYGCCDLAWDRDGERLFAAAREGAFMARLSAPEHWEVVPLGNVRNRTSWSIVESPDGRSVATGWSDGTCRLFSLDGQPGHVLHGHAARVWDVVFLDEGKHIHSTSDDCTLIKWDAATGKPLQATLILPGEQLIVYGSGGDVRKATPQAEDELLYVVEEPSGEQVIHTPAEFRARLQDAVAAQ